MNRLWSRLGARTAAVALLSAGVVGGFQLGNRDQGQHVPDVAGVEQVALQAPQVHPVKERAAEYQEKLRDAAVAEAAAERKRREEAAAASRKTVRAAAAELAKAKAKAKAAAAAKPYDGPIPESCAEFTGNRKIGCAEMLNAGFEIDQFPCLDKLFTKESGWNHKARNPSSGAYGIPQALPGSKMASKGDDWETNPATQIRWGLGYIKGRYQTPCKAWAYMQEVGWY
ncbi:aggregation-promoting factor C-terminal-like domain-containing protein [Salinispora fenicalii]|uniref:aggregation-promoting factor C-terminal-like domain-containing protein n=1 Tax=Salinispora fenicalii TaxID=1137263 RepID=UPI000372F533|nr:lytic transglycosylase domain-containing protein [Salinispora fenicalii]